MWVSLVNVARCTGMGANSILIRALSLPLPVNWIVTSFISGQFFGLKFSLELVDLCLELLVFPGVRWLLHLVAYQLILKLL